MATLLRIDSSPQKGEVSFSRRMTAEFVRQWRIAHPDGKVVERDLAAAPPVPLDAEWIAAAHTPEANLTPRQKEALSLSSTLIAEMQEADEYIIGVAMHNFSIPSLLKLWVDQVVRAGKTFSYEGGVLAGALHGKKATFAIASGAVYEPNTPRAALNFVEPYLRTIFGIIGVSDVAFVNAGGTSQVRHGLDPQVILQPALASIETRVRAAA
jgi:FMN-dependent NADH-azoreductase